MWLIGVIARAEFRHVVEEHIIIPGPTWDFVILTPRTSDSEKNFAKLQFKTVIALTEVDLAAAVGAQFDPEMGSLGCIF